MPGFFDICNFLESSRFDFDTGAAHGAVLCQRSSDDSGWAIASIDAHRGVDRAVIRRTAPVGPLVVEDLLVGECH